MKANNTLSPAPQAPAQAQDIAAFWQAAGPRRWFRKDSTFDEALRERFLAVHEAAARGECDAWARHASGSLALLILLDQFPRNIHRGDCAAFGCDARAVALAKRALNVGHDLKIDEPERQFFYLPLMHSESLADQDRCVRMVMIRMPRTGAETLRAAIEHRDTIRRFGRFPARNAALRRRNTPSERAQIAADGATAVK